jgi:uncharacterized RDD family membrane protein YckC
MEATAGCPLCGDSRRMKKPKKLYGHPVCRKCWAGFANQRQFAWIIDVFLAWVLAWVVGVFLVEGIEADDTLAWVPLAGLYGFVPLKDGLIGGRSPGKVITGVRVIDRQSGKPIGIGKSAGRNLLLLIPFMPLIVAFQMMGGPRIGDGMAGTRVIWKRYQDNQVFLPARAVGDVFE